MFLCNFYANIRATAKYSQGIIGSNTCLLLYRIMCNKGLVFSVHIKLLYLVGEKIVIQEQWIAPLVHEGGIKCMLR